MEYTGAQYEPKSAMDSGRFEGQGTFGISEWDKICWYVIHFYVLL